MTHSARPIRKYVVSAALVTSIAFTPLVGTSVSAQSNAPSSDNTTVQAQSNLLTQGDRGQAVSSLQSELSQQGYYTYSVDGIYGPITKNAVMSFQADQGLAVDGIAGPRTKAALGSGSAASASSQTEPVAVDTSASAGDSEIVAAAENLLGIPYQYGGTTRAALDSSGFINETFEQVGVDVSRTHAGMWVNDGTHVSSPSVGDVVFFEGTYNTDGPSHSGIYIGGNQMIHAGSGGVEVSNMGIDYWQNHYIGAKSIQ